MHPPDGGRDDLLGEVMRKKRHRPDLSGSKHNLSRLAGSGVSVLPIGIIPFGSRNAAEDAKLFFGQAIQKTVA